MIIHIAKIQSQKQTRRKENDKLYRIWDWRIMAERVLAKQRSQGKDEQVRRQVKNVSKKKFKGS